MGLSAYIIAGEQSGDQLGSHLIDGLKQLEPEILLSGVGGSLMREKGLSSLFDMSDLSVMGLVEVLPRLPLLLKRIKQTVADVLRVDPDVLITIDSPDFCLRVARAVKKERPGLKIVHYVAPSVWAWRPHRAQKMAQHVDHVLALLPFEPPYMEKAGMSSDFVGHPISTVPVQSEQAKLAFRESHAIPPDAPLLCLLPGSRMGEITRHSPILFDVVGRLLAEKPELHVVLPAAPAVFETVNVTFSGLDRIHVLDPKETPQEQKFAAFAASNAALAVSGTVSLELASQDTPMVVAYDAAWLTKRIIKRAFLLETATLVNIVSETMAVPEFIFENFRSQLITQALLDLLAGEGASAQSEAASLTMERLGRGGEKPGLRAARSVLNALQ